ncbi:MAG: hypothetical protein HYS86_01775, partial [Candidatus Chisholmbacteria bacterium]|nr:hypothetical protein [Candidatus Chisholmbacteria bacterium]
ARSAGEAIEYWYSKKVTDEFVEPTVMVRSRIPDIINHRSYISENSEKSENQTIREPEGQKISQSDTLELRHSGFPTPPSGVPSVPAVVKSKIAEVKEQIAETKGQISYIRNHISDIATPLRQNAGLAALSRKLEILDHSEPIATVEPGDVVFFFNFRADRARQLTQMFCDQKPYRVMSNEQEVMSNEQETRVTEGKENKTKENRDKETAGGPNGADGLFVSMTNYHEDLRVDLSAYETQPVESPVSEVVSRANLKQLYLAESEKERFVTYYFNGLRQDRFPLEDVVIVPSPKVPTYDKKPEMALPEITQAFLKGLRSGDYRFLMMNFANPDMVAHSGNLRATIKACQYVDQALKTVSEAVLRMQGTLVVTADHGNAEELLTLPRHAFFFTTSQGAVNTDHSNNPVPIVIVGEKFKGKGSLAKGGALADVAPTVLGLLGLLQPPVMTGRNLLSTIDRRT